METFESPAPPRHNHFGIEGLSSREKHLVELLHQRRHVSRDTNAEFDNSLTLGQRLADRVASFGGSWTFVTIFAVVLVTWVMLNSLILAKNGAAFDPFPYILLNLFLSMIAAIQAPIIMMSQNRRSTKDRLDAEHDYEVNLKAELEIMSLHEKLDHLREQDWASLVTLQQDQISMLTDILQNLQDTTSPSTNPR